MWHLPFCELWVAAFSGLCGGRAEFRVRALNAASLAVFEPHDRRVLLLLVVLLLLCSPCISLIHSSPCAFGRVNSRSTLCTQCTLISTEDSVATVSSMGSHLSSVCCCV